MLRSKNEGLVKLYDLQKMRGEDPKRIKILSNMRKKDKKAKAKKKQESAGFNTHQCYCY